MKIPKKLKIGGFNFKVKIVPSNDIGEECEFGDIDYDKNTIHLSKDLNHEQMCESMWHEIIHAINPNLEPDHYVEFIAHSLYSFLENNKGWHKKNPSSLKIGGVTCRVFYGGKRLGTSMARTFLNLEEMYFSQPMERDTLNVCILHEFLHVANTEMDHLTVDYLANGIYQVIKDNKLLGR